MQTGTEDRGRRVAFDALLAEGALSKTAEKAEREAGEAGQEFVRQRSALLGMRVALPLALWLWALIAGLLWAWHR